MPIIARIPSLPSRTVGFALICLFLAGFSSSACSRNPETNSQQPSGDATGGGGGGGGTRGGGRGNRGGGGGGAVPVVTPRVGSKPGAVASPGGRTAARVRTRQS